MSFDIAQLAVDETATVDLVHPATGEEIRNDVGEPLSITVYGPGSRPYQKAMSVRNRAVLEHVRKGGKKMSDGEQREMDAEFLATCTVSFNGFVYKDKAGHEMFRAAYLDATIGYIAEQVNAAVGDWSNFMKRRATS